MKHRGQWILATLLTISYVALASCNKAVEPDKTPVRIGIAWRGDSTSVTYTSTLQSVREAGAVPVPLPLLKSPAMEYDGDRLLAQYTDEHGIVEEGPYDGRRDVSDYILMAWCLEREAQLPVLCICRGMQMLSVVSGTAIIQYHPEVAVSKHSNGAADASRFMDYDQALCYFRALVAKGKEIRNSRYQPH